MIDFTESYIEENYIREQSKQTIEKEKKESIINNEILDKVKNIVNGDRLDSYGLPNDSFQRIADYWNIYMNHIVGYRNILPKDVAVMMALFKLAREENKHKEDNIIDMIAYILLYDKVRE